MLKRNFIRDYPVPLDLSPGDQIPVQPVGPRTTDYVAPTLVEHWVAGMKGTFDGINRNTSQLNLSGLPTSPIGLPPFSLWVNGSYLMVTGYE